MYNVRKIEENINMGGNFQGLFLYDQELAPRTTFKVGGPVSLLVEPLTVDSFITAVQVIRTLSIPYLVLGGCSNVVVPDEGIEYPILSTLKLSAISLSPDKSSIHCGAGCTWKQVLDFCIEHQLGGLENFSGLPGTLGGAVFMNARCYDMSMSDVLTGVDYACPSVDSTGQWTVTLESYSMNPKDWNYKVSPFQGQMKDCPVLSATLSVKPLNEAETMEMKCRSEHFVADREKKGHFSYPSAGSVFKNSRDLGKPSGKIVDEVGLRGMEEGGAQVAPWHGNFIINKKNATARDIQKLVMRVQKAVYETTGFTLEPEIIFLPRTINIE